MRNLNMCTAYDIIYVYAYMYTHIHMEVFLRMCAYVHACANQFYSFLLFSHTIIKVVYKTEEM